MGIDAIGGFLQDHLVVLLAVVLVPMKWIVLRLCGDSEAQSVTFLAIPEDLCYVSLGLVLGNFTNGAQAFQKYFKGSSHITVDILVVALINVLVAVVIHVLAKWGNENFKGWRASGMARISLLKGGSDLQMELPNTAADKNIQRIQVRHMAIFSLSYCFQVIIVIRWLYWIAQVIGKSAQ
jgi:hypothetical protein